jgi:hypothetical protein
MTAGEIAPDEAAAIGGVLEAKRKAIETVDIERRLAALEQRTGESPPCRIARASAYHEDDHHDDKEQDDAHEEPGDRMRDDLLPTTVLIMHGRLQMK